jgi:uncharacterized cupredoxin-like copper-binding protein
MRNYTVKLLVACLTGTLSVAASAAGGHDGEGHGHGHAAAQQSVAANQAHEEKDHGHDQAGHGHDQGDHASMVGSPADAAAATRTVRVDLLDTMRLSFDPPLALKRGEIVRFDVTNRGAIRHEFSVGSAAEQSEHRTMMRSMPNMVHEDGNSITVEPGDSKTLVWRFDGDEPVVFSCNIPGHAEAGMVAKADLAD